MSNDTEMNDRDREIDILKSTVDNLTQENKQLLESNKQLKKEYDKLKNFNISIFAPELENQIQLISGGSKMLLQHNELSKDILQMIELIIRNPALRLQMQVERMKHEVSESNVRDL
jgi:hypothetical protein